MKTHGVEKARASNARATARTDNQAAAINKAVQIARNQNSETIKTEIKIVMVNNPFPPRG
ncbi:DUF2188 domain-containing protein [Paenibacillus sp. E222]|uniref:DUF2188 domain-containing protein n=1 Tax=Paenibacillus sp. E222 TaxID=2748863 RepID=UPI00359C359F